MRHWYFRYLYLKTSVEKQYFGFQGRSEPHHVWRCSGCWRHSFKWMCNTVKTAYVLLLFTQVAYFVPLCQIPFPLLAVLSKCLLYLLPLRTLLSCCVIPFTLQTQPCWSCIMRTAEDKNVKCPFWTFCLFFLYGWQMQVLGTWADGKLCKSLEFFIAILAGKCFLN